MESFSIDTVLDNQHTRVLIIPDDCVDLSIFHLVENGEELCKLTYTEAEAWKVLDGKVLNDTELQAIITEIEKHYF